MSNFLLYVLIGTFFKNFKHYLEQFFIDSIQNESQTSDLLSVSDSE